MINLQDYLVVGQNVMNQHIVNDSDTSDKYITAFRELLASPRVIHWAVDAAVDAIDPYLPEEYSSIVTAINFVHTAPTSIGMTVSVHVTVEKIEGMEVVLGVKAWDDQGEIAHGTMTRYIVETEEVLKKAQERIKIHSSRRILNWAKSK